MSDAVEPSAKRSGAGQAAVTALAAATASTGWARQADAAAIADGLVARAAKDAGDARELADGLTRLLARTLGEAVALKEGPAGAIARTVAGSFLSGEILEMVLLRATASADTLSLTESQTAQTQRAITQFLTSADALAPLAAGGAAGAALNEAALQAVVRTVAASLAPDDAAAGVPRAEPSIAAKPDVVVAELAISGRYRVIETLTPGPEDAVYLARSLDTAEMVELRVIAGGLGADDALVHALADQASRVADLSSYSPAIAMVYECERAASGALVIVMEHPEGPTLAEVIRREGRLSVARALGVGIQVAKALERAHGQGLIHGGLSADNVVLTGPEQTVALTHFGFDRLLASRRAHDGDPAAAAAPAGRAPEQAAGPATSLSDVYALGSLLYAMLAGAEPAASGRVDVDQLRSRRPELTPSLERLVVRMLQETPSRRPADITVVCDELWRELSPDAQRKLPYRRTVAAAWTGKRLRHTVAWVAVAALMPVGVWFVHSRIASDTSAAPNLPMAVVPAAVAPREAPRPEAPAPERVEARTETRAPAPSADGVAPDRPELRDSDAPARVLPPASAAPRPAEPKVIARTPDRPDLAPAPARPEHRPSTIAPPPPARIESPVEVRRPPVTPPPSTAQIESPAEPRRIPAASPAPARDARESSEDPGAIIDWLLKEGAQKKR